MHFQLLLLGPPKKGAEVATHIQCLACSAHSGHHSSSPSPHQSPAASAEDVGWPERGSQVSQWERDTAPCLPPETPHAVTVKAQQQFSRGRPAISSLLHPHCLYAGGEAPHSLQGELFKSIKRKLVIWVELEQPLQLIVMLRAAHEHSAAPSARSLLLAPYAVQAEYWLFK